ncbi:hypothetical protein CROQUDRAFT_653774 [Cronartium quercuum f. sp. fusiforme G11]|uniref:HAM1-like N-terminal domain-containing protein n=1 Tax=Cronartium quercuum f. sp. fusiforme G11 TaxID=708437 RepID=A0A9P6NS49_9BASI|nr:hypothetical protein CROQUDRAFT_653774 [Cronartium quercuum f. sp. fusiforme G11]
MTQSLHLNHLTRFTAAISIGKLPTQVQLESILDSLLGSALFEEPSTELISALAGFLRAFRDFTHSKNPKNQFQTLLYAASHHLTLAPILDPPSTSQHLPTPQELSHALLNLLHIILSSESFRNLLDSTYSLLAQIGKGAPDDNRPQELIDEISRSLVSILVGIKSHLSATLRETLAAIATYGWRYADHIEEQAELTEVCEIAFECVCGFTGREPWTDLAEAVRKLIDDRAVIEIRDQLYRLLSQAMEDDERIYDPSFYRSFQSLLIRLWDTTKPEQLSEPLRILKEIRDRIVTDEKSVALVVSLADLAGHFNIEEASQQSGALSKRVWRDLVLAILPKLLAMVKEIPLPRIEFVSNSVQLAIDPLGLRSTTSFMPTYLRYTSHTTITLEKPPITERASTTIDVPSPSPSPSLVSRHTLTIRGLRLYTKDVGFYVEKKSCLVKFSDEGLVDVFVGMGTDDGLSCAFELVFDDEHWLKVKATHVEVQGLGFFPHHSSHPVLNWFLKRGLALFVQSKLASTLESHLAHQLKQLEDLVVRIRARYSNAPGPRPDQNPDEGDKDDKRRAKMKVEGVGLRIEADDGSYVIGIGLGDRLLEGKGLPGIKRGMEQVKEAAGEAASEAVGQVQAKVNGLAKAVQEGLRDGSEEEEEWRSDAFEVDN